VQGLEDGDQLEGSFAGELGGVTDLEGDAVGDAGLGRLGAGLGDRRRTWARG
jgi:hypothetical protein